MQNSTQPSEVKPTLSTQFLNNFGYQRATKRPLTEILQQSADVANSTQTALSRHISHKVGFAASIYTQPENRQIEAENQLGLS